MCGIAGVIDEAEDRAAVRVGRLNDSQRHRGPDHQALSRVGTFTLGNTRLAIQDPGPAGNQPFVSSDGRYHCVFNGEIYNHRRLIERYQLQVRTACDGEVIPALWAKLGIDSLAELRGMFAIALVDSLEERLYLARDAFGIKPVYWRILPDGTFAFASEVRPLARIAPGARINGEAVARYLHLGAMAPDQSPFLEVRALAPNTVATVGRDRQLTSRPILTDGPLRAAASSASLGDALADSIELHLGADVPTALLLSAGVDSATLAAVGRRSGRDLHCLTIATEGSADESADAAATAGHYGHSFERIPARLDDSDVARFFGAMQRPTIDGLNTYVVCQAVREAGFKVALSGLGGDEAVGGYSHFRLLPYLPVLCALRGLPGPVTGAIARVLAHRGVASEAKASRLLSPGGPRDGAGLSLLQREVLPAPLVSGLTGMPPQPIIDVPVPGAGRLPGSFGAMAGAEVAIYLQSMLLPDADAFSMASSVELRVPFVDTGVFGASLALSSHQSRRPGKPAIGAALADPYLSALAARPKRGFSVPMRTWLAGPLASTLQAAREPDAPVWSVVDRALADRAGLSPLKVGNRWSEVWTFAALNAWLAGASAPPRTAEEARAS
jgi:asparagine synthase (glutamine-hydrolysing)